MPCPACDRPVEWINDYQGSDLCEDCVARWLNYLIDAIHLHTEFDDLVEMVEQCQDRS